MKIRVYLNDVNEETNDKSFQHCNFFKDYSDMNVDIKNSFIDYEIDGFSDITANAQTALSIDPNVKNWEII